MTSDNADRIYLRNLRASIIVGILEHEKVTKQEVVVNVRLSVDCRAAALSDDIVDAVDYSLIHDELLVHMKSTEYGLIETLAEKLTQICLKDERVKDCLLSIDKPEALQHADSVAVEIFRTQK
ncbi:MAG: dihydroneopterin aldolase [Lentisphaeraceae bacterium]|nr:dihydroneopterin aldolase [Lentisphaeraceae bacterium]